MGTKILAASRIVSGNAGNARARMFALGRLKPGEMNNTEKEYRDYLEAMKQDGVIVWYAFEGIKLRLADNTFYTPDFLVINSKMEVECHEVKGRWMDDARVKIKIAAGRFPFRFIAVTKRAKKDGGGWNEESF